VTTVARVEDSSLPSGRYLSLAIDVHPDNAGQTRALLMRNRIFASRTNVIPSVLSFGASNDMDERRAILHERGLLSDGVELLNIFEHYRETDWPGDVATGVPLENLSAKLVKETNLPDGRPWRRTYQRSDGSKIYDYLRSDGTPFLRMPAFIFREAGTWPTSVLRVSRAGEVLGEYKSPAGWYRRWVREMSAGHERSFVFIDSRFLAPLIAPMSDPSIHLIYLLHNIHLAGDHRWDSPTTDVHERLLSLVGQFDAFVTLTERQRDDIAERVGRLSNLFVVPNPVDLPPMPNHVRRDPHQVTIMARLVSQKRLRQAILAMREVIAEIPDARLDIYGDGPRREALQRTIEEFGLDKSVTLKGHDPRARESLWRSSAFIMTSGYEGYPLSTLESMSHGCPVVSYDIKYGPREQITDGVDGFLVPDGDLPQLTSRLKQLVANPSLVERMGAAAREKAAYHGYDRFLSDWVKVVNATVQLKNGRTTLEDVRLEVRELSVRSTRIRSLQRRSLPGVHEPRAELRFAGRLIVRGRSRAARIEDATVSLTAVHERTSAVVDVPLEVRHSGDGFDLRAEVPLGALYPSNEDTAGRSHLRLRLVWNNSSWEMMVRRAPVQAGSQAAIEVSFERDEKFTLLRH